MIAIKKYSLFLPDADTFILHTGTKIVDLIYKDHNYHLIAEVDTDLPARHVRIYFLKIGEELPEDVEVTYIGRIEAMLPNWKSDTYVYMEVNNPPKKSPRKKIKN